MFDHVIEVDEYKLCACVKRNTSSSGRCDHRHSDESTTLNTSWSKTHDAEITTTSIFEWTQKQR